MAVISKLRERQGVSVGKDYMNIADAYNVSTDYLVGRSDSPRPVQFDEKEVREAFALRDMIGSTVAKQLAATGAPQ